MSEIHLYNDGIIRAHSAEIYKLKAQNEEAMSLIRTLKADIADREKEILRHEKAIEETYRSHGQLTDEELVPLF